jgi:hypothetical protein
MIPGNYPVKSKEDIPAALEALKERPLYAEKWANFTMVSVCPITSSEMI